MTGAPAPPITSCDYFRPDNFGPLENEATDGDARRNQGIHGWVPSGLEVSRRIDIQCVKHPWTKETQVKRSDTTKARRTANRSLPAFAYRVGPSLTARESRLRQNPTRGRQGERVKEQQRLARCPFTTTSPLIEGGNAPDPGCRPQGPTSLPSRASTDPQPVRPVLNEEHLTRNQMLALSGCSGSVQDSSHTRVRPSRLAATLAAKKLDISRHQPTPSERRPSSQA